MVIIVCYKCLMGTRALVDTEIVATDDLLAVHGVGKGLMTLVDEERQDHLIKPLS